VRNAVSWIKPIIRQPERTAQAGKDGALQSEIASIARGKAIFLVNL